MSYITLNARIARILLFGPAGMASKQSGSEFNRDGLGMMKWRVKKAAPKTQEELMETIRTVWEELDQETLNRMVVGFERRLAMAIKIRG
jgi:hypothetical protein